MPESKNALSNPQYSRQITRKNELLSNKKNAPGLHFSNNVFEVIGTVSRQFITFLPKHFECKETPNFPPLRSFCAQKAVAFVVFCSLVFVLLVGFGFVYVFARSKFFRKKKKKKKKALNCPNHLKYNTTHRTRQEGEGWGKGTAHRSPCFTLA